MSAYGSTTVPVERSQGEIRKLLIRAQVGQLAFGEDRDETGQRWAAVTFRHGALAVRIRVPLKVIDERTVSAKYQRARSKGRDEIRDASLRAGGTTHLARHGMEPEGAHGRG